MESSTAKLKIRLVPEGDSGIPLDMLHNYFVAHQETLRIIIQSENKNKRGTIPELRLVDVKHSSMEFQFSVQSLQMVLPLANSYLKKMATDIRDSVLGMDTFEETETETTTTTRTRTKRLPKRVTDKLSAPFLAGVVKRAEVYEDDNPEPLYTIASEDVKPNLLEIEPVPELETATERGEVCEFVGDLREIDWEKRTCRFFVEMDGKSRPFKCSILDEAFLDQDVRRNLRVRLQAIPIYQSSPFGERTIKILEAQEITVLEAA